MNDRDALARLLPDPARSPLAPGRHQTIKEFVMSEIRQSPPRRRWLVPVLAGLATAGVAVAVLLPSTAQAYAVRTNPDGTITVRIFEARDSEGLEAELRANGLNAVVDYVPKGKRCSPQPRSTSWVEGVRLASPMTEEEEAGGAGFRLDPSQVKPGQTAVLEFLVDESFGAMNAGISDQVSAGPVAECTLADR